MGSATRGASGPVAQVLADGAPFSRLLIPELAGTPLCGPRSFLLCDMDCWSLVFRAVTVGQGDPRVGERGILDGVH